jgi:hypothetical protein
MPKLWKDCVVAVPIKGPRLLLQWASSPLPPTPPPWTPNHCTNKVLNEPPPPANHRQPPALTWHTRRVARRLGRAPCCRRQAPPRCLVLLLRL